VGLWQIVTHGPVGRTKVRFFREVVADARANHISGAWVTLLRIIVPINTFLLKFIPPKHDPRPRRASPA
jgi:hypothetical protein